MNRRTLLASALLGLPAALGAGELSNRRVPSFALPDINLKTHDVLDYRGKPLLIEVMMTNCPHCQSTAPTLERIKTKYAGKINVLAIVIPPDTQATVAAYVTKHRISYPILFDCGQATATLVKATPDKPRISVPYLFLVDAKGTIREDWGSPDENKAIFEGAGMDPFIDRLLAGK